MKFVKETEQYAANFRKSAASCVREETSEREKSYKGYVCVCVRDGELQECTRGHGHNVSQKQSHE